VRLQLNNTNSTLQLKKNISAAKVLNAFLRLYKNIRKYLGRQISKVIVFVSSPLVYLLLRFLRSRIQKYSANIIIDTNNYVEYRHTYDVLSHLIGKINISDVSDNKLNDIPFYARYVAKEFMLILRAIKESHGNLGAALRNINKDSPKSNFFTLSTEAELWESRNKSYDYLR